MNDKMNELTQFSPFAGKLILEKVPGEAAIQIEHENDVRADNGMDRTMYAYAPKSGCPDPKQCQVLMVLRENNGEDSAVQVMKTLGLDVLAEEEHFLLLFPNPAERGWNYGCDPGRDNDMDFLIRCFGVLRTGNIGVNGFNGMIFYLAAGPAASAMLMTMGALRPLNVPAMMLSQFPEDYILPEQALNIEVAAFVSSNPKAAEYLRQANGASSPEEADDITISLGRNPNVRLLETRRGIDKDTVRLAWDQLFSQSRRWQNDTYGTYQKRTNFTSRGFTAHVKDTSLGCNNGFAHTWYEYIPPKLRDTTEKVPLLFYFHGVNCVPLYGAEQSNWHDIADRENFIVVYPAPAVHKAWNIFNDPSLPSDFAFVLALIEHMKRVHPIDESRIYITGFSMGGMMTHALSSVYPDLFAAAAPCNAFDFAYFKTPASVYSKTVRGIKPDCLSSVSVQRRMADEKKAACNYRMPLFQNAGFIDDTIALWPVDESTRDTRTETIARWKACNNIPDLPMFDNTTLTGLAADENFYEDTEERFFHQRWHSADEGNPVLFEMITAKRMPHAISPVQLEYAWEFLERFRRMPDGSLMIDE